ncbi:hypothetical protein [Roseinatronobacter bogoriensis]|uniref:hypothetical protein n=1 Tax=Roseinatronobacter bogoriensis TaxID=119542 RepID=UPI0018E20289|nr:hypothetical protein [Rhodobaca barguzinensis]
MNSTSRESPKANTKVGIAIRIISTEEHTARAVTVQRHADDDAGRDGQRHVRNREQADIVTGQPIDRGKHRTCQRGHVEPDIETHEKRNPRQMECFDLCILEAE